VANSAALAPIAFRFLLVRMFGNKMVHLSDPGEANARDLVRVQKINALLESPLRASPPYLQVGQIHIVVFRHAAPKSLLDP